MVARRDTPDELEWFAREGMGWDHATITTLYPTYGDLKQAGLWVIRTSDTVGENWNPRTSLADAVELADAVFVHRCLTSIDNAPKDQRCGCYAIATDDEEYETCGPNDQTAICEAVREKLARAGKC